jgi:pilus assembly protein FimV
MVYSPSQLDAAGDVDPVAEADVYLAYGRDLQAEEILKEALRVSPQRVAIHSKLLEIYAKRRDAKAFEVTATDAYALTGGEGPEWEHICDLGRELDGGNPLYQPGGHPSGVAPLAAGVAAAGAAAAASALDAPASTSPDLDLDLDFSAGDDGPQEAASLPTPPVQAVHLHTAPEPAGGLDLDFGAGGHQLEPEPAVDAPLSFELPIVEEPKPTAAAAPVVAATPDVELADNALSFDLDALEPSAAPAPAATASAPAPVADDKMIEFDLGGLSLELDGGAPAAAAPAPAATPVAPAPALAAATAAPVNMAKTEKFHVGATDSVATTQGLEAGEGDPLATKFALAQEFNAIGDPDGARSLAEEVLAEASGDLKSRAQKFLAEIG